MALWYPAEKLKHDIIILLNSFEAQCSGQRDEAHKSQSKYHPPITSMSKPSESSRDEVRGMGVSRKRGGDPKDADAEDRTGLKNSARSVVQKEEYRLSNWARTKPGQAMANSAAAAAVRRVIVCCLHVAFFAFFLAVNKPHINRRWRILVLEL